MFLGQIIDPALAQHAYLIGCARSGDALLIEPERDLDRYFRLAAENDLRMAAVADTHIHADYLSGARELMERHGALAHLPAEGGPDWQSEWAKQQSRARWLRNGDRFRVGNVTGTRAATGRSRAATHSHRPGPAGAVAANDCPPR